MPRPLDPRRALVRLLLRLEDRVDLVTFADIERAARRYPRALPREQLESRLGAAVDELLILVDHRLYLDRDSDRLENRLVYRVNRRHPLAREELPY